MLSKSWDVQHILFYDGGYFTLRHLAGKLLVMKLWCLSLSLIVVCALWRGTDTRLQHAHQSQQNAPEADYQSR